MQARKIAVTSTRDMAACTDRIATAGGQCESITFVKRLIGVSEHGARPYAVLTSRWIRIYGIQQRQIEQNTAGIVCREILIAVSAGANGRADSVINGFLQSLTGLGGRSADHDASWRDGGALGKPEVVSSQQRFVPRVLPIYREIHFYPSHRE
jgi:hypothetical protein